MRRKDPSSLPENQGEPDRDTSRDPYALWHGRPEAELPFDEVRDGVARYLHTFYRLVWLANTQHQHPRYLTRIKGLNAWCKYEAGQRLKRGNRETYSITEFHESVFREDLRRGGKNTLSDPFWRPLLILKASEGDTKFFKQLDWLVNQPESQGAAFHQKRVLCIGWDRALIPLACWNYPAIAAWLALKLGNKAPSSDTLKHWGHELELIQESPTIVTGYDKGGPVIDPPAFEYHNFPDPPEE
jgi:hypothetical protein